MLRKVVFFILIIFSMEQSETNGRYFILHHFFLTLSVPALFSAKYKSFF